MKTPICFYHSGDMDGICSATIIKKAIPNVELYGIDYEDIPNFPWDKIQDRKVIMVDFSLPVESMGRLNFESSQFIWIDHHKTAIDEVRKHKLKLNGMRSTTRAACSLTWNYFFPDEPLLLAVYLISCWDIWKHDDPRVEPFHLGLQATYVNPNDPRWLDYKIEDIIEIGNNIIQYIKNEDKITMQRAYPVTFDGYKALVVNAPHGGKKFNQHPNKDQYDIFICYVGIDRRRIRISLYSNNPKIDVGLIAKKYGGGGHKNAAGYITDFPKFFRF